MQQQEIFIQMAVKSWDIQINRAGSFFDAVPDEGLYKEIAPGKNRIIYILGHLIAVNDSMLTLLGLGERSYADFDELFIKNPDRSQPVLPDPSALRHAWKTSNQALSAHFSAMLPGDWFGRHTAMTEEDLAKDPARNKLSVLLNRTAHVAYHLGQLVLAKRG